MFLVVGFGDCGVEYFTTQNPQKQKKLIHYQANLFNEIAEGFSLTI